MQILRTGGVERVGTNDKFLKTCVIKENKFNFRKRNLFTVDPFYNLCHKKFKCCEPSNAFQNAFSVEYFTV